MDTRTLDYGAIKLRDALRRITDADTLQEGLYDAYLEDIQWLVDLEGLPEEIASGVRRLNEELTQMPGPDLATRARATISRLSPDEGAALAKLMATLTQWLEAVGEGRPAGRSAGRLEKRKHRS